MTKIKQRFSSEVEILEDCALLAHLETGEFVAVKKIKGDHEIQQSRNEGALQTKLEGKPNILPILDFVESVSSEEKPVLYQFMPLAGFGNGEELRMRLQSVAHSQEQILTHVAQSLLTGLHHMHQAGIYHLDLKPSNMVIDQQGVVYIIDFGCAKELTDGMLYEEALGDSKYFSPERLAYARQLYHHQTPAPIDAGKIDAWALGITLLELASGSYPFDKSTFIQKVYHWDISYFEQKLASILQLSQPGSFMTLVKGLLDPNPNTRLSIQDALAQLGQGVFSDVSKQKAAFDALKQVDISEPIVAAVTRNEDENYGDVYVSRYGTVLDQEDKYGDVFPG